MNVVTHLVPDRSSPTPSEAEERAGTLNANRVYGYSGLDNQPFLLNQRLTDAYLQDPSAFALAPAFTGADPLSGMMSEASFAPGPGFDGSETIYYLISNVDPNTKLIGASPVDASGESYLVTASQLDDIRFEGYAVTTPTYFDLDFNVIIFHYLQTVCGLSYLYLEM